MRSRGHSRHVSRGEAEVVVAAFEEAGPAAAIEAWRVQRSMHTAGLSAGDSSRMCISAHARTAGKRMVLRRRCRPTAAHPPHTHKQLQQPQQHLLRTPSSRAIFSASTYSATAYTLTPMNATFLDLQAGNCEGRWREQEEREEQKGHPVAQY